MRKILNAAKDLIVDTFVVLKWSKKHLGWHAEKRLSVWLLIFPILAIPIFFTRGIKGFYEYWKFITTYDCFHIKPRNGEPRKLNRAERIYYKNHLIK